MTEHAILITGATGFVGQTCCKEAYSRGYRVRGVVRHAADRLTPGIENVLVGEIDDKTDWQAALQEVGTVIHLAARVHVMHEQSENAQASFMKVNFYGTLNLARQAALAGIKRFV